MSFVMKSGLMDWKTLKKSTPNKVQRSMKFIFFKYFITNSCDPSAEKVFNKKLSEKASSGNVQ